MGDRNGADAVQQSLFGRNERAEQLRRLVFPDGLRDRSGHTVSANALKSVLLAIDDRDQGGYGGKGCVASIETLCSFANVKRRTCLRALEVLEEVCGFITRVREQVGLNPTVDRRVCWPAVRAFNDGEALGGECPDSGGECPDSGGECPDSGGECPTGHEVSAPRGTLNVSLKHKKHKSLNGSKGLLDLWRGGSLNTGDLDDDERLVGRFAEAVSAGMLRDCEADRLAFVAWGLYCRREARNPAALFTAGLLGRADRYGRGWRHKPTNDDDDRARALLRRIDGRDEPDDAKRRPAAMRPDSPAARIRRLWRDTDRTTLLWIARQRLGRDSPDYRDFSAALDAAGGGLELIEDGELVRIFGGKLHGRRDAAACGS